ncbi:MAG TPA: AraC family transcriptional regulator [Ruminiclostridium sp.]
MDKINLKENIKHGDYIFPLMVYSNKNRQDDTIQYCHWHDELEFLFVTKGKAIFQVEGIYYAVDEGQAVFINQGYLHAGFAVNHTSCNFCAIVFNPEMLFSKSFDVMQTKYLEPIIRKQYVLPVHICGVQSWEKEIIKKLFEIAEIFTLKSTAFELIIKANLYLIFSTMLSNTDPVNHDWNLLIKNHKTENIKKTLSYIHENYQNKMNITELAKLTNMSGGHFYRFFKQMTRKTPIDYINNYRVNQAAFLLTDSNNKISQIALDVGFENISYFIKIFKKHLKCTPKEYRIQNNNSYTTLYP